jgi:signal transduction histidine kinase
VTEVPAGSGDDQLARLRRLGLLAGGLAHEISTPMQYIGDNARFLAEAVSDLRGMLAWYQACVRLLAQGRHARLLDEMSAMESRIDLEHLLAEMPTAILHSLEGIGQVSASAAAFRDFVEASDEVGPNDLARALDTALTVSRNHTRQRAELTLAPGAEVPRVHCAPSRLLPLLVDLALAAAAAAPSAGTVRVTTRRAGDGRALAEFAAERGGTDPEIAALRADAVAIGGALAVQRAADGGWTLTATLPALSQAGKGAA